MNPILRPGLVIGLACLVPAAAGCHSLDRGSAAKSDPQSATSPGAAAALAAPLVKQDPALARTDFRKEATPLQQFNVHVEVGRAQEAQEHYQEAIAEYGKAIEASQKHGSVFAGSTITAAQQALAHRRLAAAFDHLGKFAQSEVHFREALKLSPNDPKVWNDAGYSCYLQGRWDDAVRDFKMAEKLEPGNPRVQTNLGLVYAATGKNDDALNALTRAGGQAIGNANMAFLMAAQGKNDLARKHYQTALTIKPDLAPARQALAALDARDVQARQLARLNAAPTLPPLPSAAAPTALARAVPAKPATDPSLSRASTSVVPRPAVKPIVKPRTPPSPPIASTPTPR